MTDANPIHRGGPGINAGVLDRVEAQLGHALPTDYREFLLESNGGIPLRQVFRPQGATPEDEYWIDDFFWIGPKLAQPSEDADPGEISFWIARFADQLPEASLPIAAASRDSVVIISLQPDSKGEVSLIDWDLAYDGTREPTREDMERARRKVADSFGDFYRGLYASE